TEEAAEEEGARADPGLGRPAWSRVYDCCRLNRRSRFRRHGRTPSGRIAGRERFHSGFVDPLLLFLRLVLRPARPALGVVALGRVRPIALGIRALPLLLD